MLSLNACSMLERDMDSVMKRRDVIRRDLKNT